MKVLLITSGQLPVPATKGGAIENLIQEIMKENEVSKDFEFTVISTFEEKATLEAVNYTASKVVFAEKRQSKWQFLMKKIYKKIVQKTFKRRDNVVIYPEIIWAAKEEIKREAFDCVIVYNLPEYILPIRKIFNGKLVLYLHNDNFNKRSLRSKQIFQACTHILTVSEYIKKQVLTINNSDALKVTSVVNGRDLMKYRPISASTKQEIRQQLGVENDEAMIIFSGRLHKWKGIYELICAFKQMPDISKVKLVVAGGAFYSTYKKNRFVKQLEREASAIKKNIIFTGYVSSEKIPELLMAADIAVVPTISEEPSGLVVLEAQAAGLPLVTTHRGGIPEIVSDKSAILLDPGTNFVPQLAATLDNLVKNPEKRIEMGTAGKALVQKYSTQAYYGHLKREIEKIVQ